MRALPSAFRGRPYTSIEKDVRSAAEAHLRAAPVGDGQLRAKWLSEACLASAAIGDADLFGRATTAMLADDALGVDTSPFGLWLRGRVALGTSQLRGVGQEELTVARESTDTLVAALEAEAREAGPAALNVRSGWALGYYLSSRPSEYAQWRSYVLRAGAAPGDELASVLWTHTMNAYAAAAAAETNDCSASVGAFVAAAEGAGLSSARAALGSLDSARCPRWMGAFLAAAARKAGLAEAEELSERLELEGPPPPPNDSADAMLAAATHLLHR
mmetsp:Transcript_12961/g.42743  ORF Transcript_12961/g.42743 Transcript_12961/m.42743 type:complete len:273 (+) Transcript_12961:2-820(+)